MKKQIVLCLSLCAVLMPRLGLAQTSGGQAADVAKTEQIAAAQKDARAAARPPSRFVDTLTNVQIEVTLTDQMGTDKPAKKTVSMIAASGSWGRIRSTADMKEPGQMPMQANLSVDARPFVALDGQIQLELTVVYTPPVTPADTRVGPKPRPAGLNQSQTIILQSGKAMLVSQAADPTDDRKVVFEVKATVLK